MALESFWATGLAVGLPLEDLQKTLIHAIAGTAAILIIASFWTSTLVSEVFLNHTAVTEVKHGILYTLFLLVPLMAVTGGSGFSLGKMKKGTSSWDLVLDRKKKRMGIIAGNGLLLMIPLAIFLNGKAASGDFDNLFYAVQAVELVVGAIQIILLGLNFRDGLKLSGKSRLR
jgi:hypothetical protein